jgi:ATP-binding cassette subfamily F protein uup
MNLLSVENLTKSYTERKLLDGVTFGLEDTDRVGIIGVNGTGKSTFLKIIAGVELPDEGKVTKGNQVNIEYLSQVIDFDPDQTVIEEVFKGHSKNLQLVRRYEAAISDEHTPTDLILRLTAEMDSTGAWGLESEAKTILTKLGISDFNQKVGTLSGGQRKRVALASALINPAEILILDEPTNHLDSETIDWLENHLKSRKGALLMITHDRYFLDRVVNKIIEIDRGNLYTYEGNYNYYLEKKIEREEQSMSIESKKRNLFRKELAWIRRGAQARSTKQKARIDRFNDLSDSLDYSQGEKLDMSVAGTRLGRKIIEIENISKSFGDLHLIKDFTYTVLRDDRVGILGPNGMGKSTLINIITGKLKPDTGTVNTGETVKIGLFSQENQDMDSEMRAIEFIKEGGEYVETSDGSKITAAQMMERFLFDKTLQWTPIGKLSGGERRRLQLLRILMEAPNILVLDEPTNDLDISTLTVLEDYIEGFPGAVIIVSHDRYLLDKVVEKLFVFEGDGQIVSYTGNYAYFSELMATRAEKAPKEKSEVKVKERSKSSADKVKFSFSEQREWDEIDDVIEKLETELGKVCEAIEKTTTDYEALEKWIAEKHAIENALEEKMERWVYLNEIAEKI